MAPGAPRGRVIDGGSAVRHSRSAPAEVLSRALSSHDLLTTPGVPRLIAARTRSCGCRWQGVNRLCAAAILGVLAATPGIAAAHGMVGDYTFIEPMVAEDANPKNEFSILRPSWVRTAEGREFALGFSLEKKLAENASVSIGSAWIDSRNRDEDTREIHTRTGFDNLDLMLKYAFLTIEEHEFRLSAALEMSVPTGDPAVGAETHFRLGPELLWAKGMGDLPNWDYIKYLRPLGFQGDVGYTANTTGRAVHELFADEVIEYSLPYLTNSVRDFGLPWPIRNLYLYTEFNYEQLTAGPSQQ